MEVNLQKDQPTKDFGSDFNDILLTYDETTLPSPTVNPKISRTQYTQLNIHLN